MNQLKKFWVILGAVTLEAFIPVIVLFFGSVFPLVLLSYLWSGSMFRALEVMTVANEHLQFYHIQLLLVPLFVVSLIEWLSTITRIETRMSYRNAMKGLVAAPLIALCAIVILMLMHAVDHYPRDKMPLEGSAFAEGVLLVLCCFWLMVVAEIGNAVVRSRNAAIAIDPHSVAPPLGGLPRNPNDVGGEGR